MLFGYIFRIIENIKKYFIKMYREWKKKSWLVQIKAISTSRLWKTVKCTSQYCNKTYCSLSIEFYVFQNHFWNNWYFVTLVNLIFGGLGVTCSPQDPRFLGSNPVEVDGFFQDVKILSTSPPEGTLSRGSRVWDFRLVKESQAWKMGLWAKFNRHTHTHTHTHTHIYIYIYIYILTT